MQGLAEALQVAQRDGYSLANTQSLRGQCIAVMWPMLCLLLSPRLAGMPKRLRQSRTDRIGFRSPAKDLFLSRGFSFLARRQPEAVRSENRSCSAERVSFWFVLVMLRRTATFDVADSDD